MRTINPDIQAQKIIECFLLSLVFMFVCAYIIGPERKAKWFKRRKENPFNFFLRRGFLGDGINFGYPRTWQGLVVMIAMYGIIIGCSYMYIFKF